MEMIYLNDDCLCQIFGCLELKDQLVLTKVCTRFQNLIVDYIWRKRYRKINTDEILERGTLPTFCGQSELPGFNRKISDRELTFNLGLISSLNKEEYQDFFTLNAANIRELYFYDFKTAMFFSYLGRFVQRPDFSFYLSLKYAELTVMNCEYSELHDGHMLVLTKNCPMLEELGVHSPYVTGKWIKLFSKLRRLTARRCNLQTPYLDEILTEADHLKYLDVRNNRVLLDSDVPTWGKSLQELKINDEEFEKQFFTHPMPERLGGIKCINLYFITRKKWPQLQDMMILVQPMTGCVKKLKIVADLHFVSNLDCNEFSPLFPHLEELHLQLSNNRVKDNIVYDFVKNAVGNVLKCLRYDPDRIELRGSHRPLPGKFIIEAEIGMNVTDDTSSVKLFATIFPKNIFHSMLSSFHIEFH